MQPLLTHKLNNNLLIGHDVELYYATPHNHDHYEFLFVVRGRALNLCNDDVQVIYRCMLLAIRPNDVHYLKKIQDETEKFEFFNIPVPIEYMKEQYKKCKDLKRIIEDRDVPVSVLLSGSELGVLCAKALRLSLLENSNNRDYLYYCLVKEICSCVIGYDELEYVHQPKWFVDLIREIENIPPENLDYDVILEKSMVSKSLLWKMFKKVYNMTPTTYVNKKKIILAYDMILNTDLTLTEIAYQIGYGSYSHFFREFVKINGKSPMELRKNRK